MLIQKMYSADFGCDHTRGGGGGARHLTDPRGLASAAVTFSGIGEGKPFSLPRLALPRLTAFPPADQAPAQRQSQGAEIHSPTEKNSRLRRGVLQGTSTFDNPTQPHPIIAFPIPRQKVRHTSYPSSARIANFSVDRDYKLGMILFFSGFLWLLLWVAQLTVDQGWQTTTTRFTRSSRGVPHLSTKLNITSPPLQKHA